MKQERNRAVRCSAWLGGMFWWWCKANNPPQRFVFQFVIPNHKAALLDWGENSVPRAIADNNDTNNVAAHSEHAIDTVDSEISGDKQCNLIAIFWRNAGITIKRFGQHYHISGAARPLRQYVFNFIWGAHA